MLDVRFRFMRDYYDISMMRFFMIISRPFSRSATICYAISPPLIRRQFIFRAKIRRCAMPLSDEKIVIYARFYDVVTFRYSMPAALDMDFAALSSSFRYFSDATSPLLFQIDSAGAAARGDISSIFAPLRFSELAEPAAPPPCRLSTFSSPARRRRRHASTRQRQDSSLRLIRCRRPPDSRRCLYTDRRRCLIFVYAIEMPVFSPPPRSDAPQLSPRRSFCFSFAHGDADLPMSSPPTLLFADFQR